MCVFDKFKGFFACLIKGLPIVVTVASAITAVVPNPSPDALLAVQILHKVADTVALNVGENSQNPN